MLVLLLNAGSSSLKGSLMESADQSTLASASADWAGSATRYRFEAAGGRQIEDMVPWRTHGHAVQRLMDDLRQSGTGLLKGDEPVAAVGHRVVHGGEFDSAVRVTSEVRSRIEALCALAPLHNPTSLETLAAAEAALPNVPHVVVFDTAFHATIPLAARTYAVPAAWTENWGIRRFGFHGISHAWASQRAAELLGRPVEELRLVVCHLGHGCSAAAVKHGLCVDTTMGFTPLEGLMMATRSGSIDPGIILHVQRQHGLTAAEVDRLLHRESGLLGISQVSADMREVLLKAAEGHSPSQLAVTVYAHRVRQSIGALAVTMGGIEALVFTAGVGEHAGEVRAAICEGLQCLGLTLDPRSNRTLNCDADIAARDSTGRILVIRSREDCMMLRDVLKVIGAVSAP